MFCVQNASYNLHQPSVNMIFMWQMYSSNLHVGRDFVGILVFLFPDCFFFLFSIIIWEIRGGTLRLTWFFEPVHKTSSQPFSHKKLENFKNRPGYWFRTSSCGQGRQQSSCESSHPFPGHSFCFLGGSCFWFIAKSHPGAVLSDVALGFWPKAEQCPNISKFCWPYYLYLCSFLL